MDSEEANLLQTLLLDGLGLRPNEVRFTHVPETSIPEGREWFTQIREDLEGVEVLVAVLTPNFIASNVCFGRAWVFEVYVRGMTPYR